MKKGIVTLLFILILLFVVCGLDSTFFCLLSSFLVAYVLQPLMERLQKRKIKKEYASVIILTGFFCFFLSLGYLFIPIFIEQLSSFIQATPKAIELIISYLKHNLPEKMFPFAQYTKNSTLKTILESEITDYIQKTIMDKSDAILLVIKNNFFSGVQIIANFFLFPSFLAYSLEHIRSIEKEMISWFPYSQQGNKAFEILRKCERVFQGYFRGQLVVSFLLGILYTLGFSFIGLNYALLLGVIAGIMSVVPYLGACFSIAFCLISAAAQGITWSLSLGVGIVYLIVYLVESYQLVPKMVGNRVGLSSLEALMAIVIGGNFMGILGIALALPFGGIFKVFVLEFKNLWLTTWKKEGLS